MSGYLVQLVSTDLLKVEKKAGLVLEHQVKLSIPIKKQKDQIMSNYGQIFLYVGVVWAFIALGLLLLAWHAVTQGNIQLHRRLMIFLTFMAWTFIVAYLLRYNTPGAIPEISPQYIPWIAIHGSIALIPLFGATGLILVRLISRKEHHFNRHHRYYGRVLLMLWCFTHLGGIVNFWLFK